MYRRGCLVKVLLALLTIGLLLAAARGVGRFGWWWGYRMGQWSLQEEREGTPFRDLPRGPSGFGYWPGTGLWAALCGVGLLAKLGLVLLLVALLGRLIGHRAFRPAYGPHGWRWHGPRYGSHWHGPVHGPCGPWGGPCGPRCGPHGARDRPEEKEPFQAKVDTESTGNPGEA